MPIPGATACSLRPVRDCRHAPRRPGLVEHAAQGVHRGSIRLAGAAQQRDAGRRGLEIAVDDVGARLHTVATFHDGCHALRELGIRAAPRRLLANVRGLELREMQPAEECCGFGGTFSVKFAELSGAMAQTKIGAIARTGADTVVSLDPSCLMQIQGALSRAGSRVRTMHLAEVLASR